ncbi:MAG: hypothetical protein DMG54_24090 [Acidobacteria bacterium]|nr:MAG: hypothetical protein DMG54_24090 [Acidobacteriota bacterium]PYU41405.1 MAG: hypothetical protein DMG53_21395 [Acidobacteriota bacterium]PYU76503.1 MAG: hypothetical protein DMG52_03755 [Acidobacteriota bacterium]
MTPPADELEIVIQSEDMAPLFEKTKTFFKQAPIFSPENPYSTLPSHVRWDRDEKGFVAAAVFLFSKED